MWLLSRVSTGSSITERITIVKHQFPAPLDNGPSFVILVEMSDNENLVAFRADDDLRTALDKLCELHKKNRSEMLRALIRKEWDEARQYLGEAAVS